LFFLAFIRNFTALCGPWRLNGVAQKGKSKFAWMLHLFNRRGRKADAKFLQENDSQLHLTVILLALSFAKLCVHFAALCV
jgi:hypothetical protein